MEDETIAGEEPEEIEEEQKGHVRPRDRLKKGIYLFPNLVTSAGLMLGFTSILKGFDGEFVFAAWAIAAAMIFDGLDGKIARLTRTTSEFGVQYDSLADLVSFGVAPGVLIYNFALRHSFSPGLGWAIALLFTICGALRLARFNVQSATVDGKWFVGMPIPAGAGVLATTVLFFNDIGWVTSTGITTCPNLILLLTLVVALLMVSTAPYWAAKEFQLFRRHAFSTLFLAIIFLVIIIREPQRTLFVMGMLYLMSGPVVWLVRSRGDKEEDLVEERVD